MVPGTETVGPVRSESTRVSRATLIKSKIRLTIVVLVVGIAYFSHSFSANEELPTVEDGGGILSEKTQLALKGECEQLLHDRSIHLYVRTAREIEPGRARVIVNEVAEEFPKSSSFVLVFISVSPHIVQFRMSEDLIARQDFGKALQDAWRDRVPFLDRVPPDSLSRLAADTVVSTVRHFRFAAGIIRIFRVAEGAAIQDALSLGMYDAPRYTKAVFDPLLNAALVYVSAAGYSAWGLVVFVVSVQLAIGFLSSYSPRL